MLECVMCHVIIQKTNRIEMKSQQLESICSIASKKETGKSKSINLPGVLSVVHFMTDVPYNKIHSGCRKSLLKIMKIMFGCIFRQNLSFHNFLILIFMTFTLPLNSLDIPFDGLKVLSQFHCFDINICTSPLEYCSSYARECRPCTEDICAKREGGDFPLQCNLNCSIVAAKIKESEYDRTFQNFIQNNASLWFGLLVTMVPAAIVLTGSWCKRHSIIRRCKSGFKKTRRGKQIKASTNEELGLFPQEENTSAVPYCEKLKVTCETNEDKQKTIATTQDKGLSSSPTNSALQPEIAKTVAREDMNSDLTESKLADDTCSELRLLTEIDMSGLDSAPLKAAPPLDLQTLQKTV